VIGSVLTALIFAILCLYVPYRREHRIANEIKERGAHVVWEYRGPNWVPRSCRRLVRLFYRVDYALWPNATDADLAHLCELANLHILDIHEAEITDAGLLRLQGLEELSLLDLSRTKISDVGLRHLHGMNIKYLYLNGTGVTDAGLQYLHKLNKLENVQLDDTQITDAGLDNLNGMNRLRQIHLIGTQTTAARRQVLRKELNCLIYPLDSDLQQ
jgi:hypothetical protein